MCNSMAFHKECACNFYAPRCLVFNVANNTLCPIYLSPALGWAKGKCRQSAATAAMAAIGGSAGGTLAAVRWRHFLKSSMQGSCCVGPCENRELIILSGGKVGGKIGGKVCGGGNVAVAAMLRWRQCCGGGKVGGSAGGSAGQCWRRCGNACVAGGNAGVAGGNVGGSAWWQCDMLVALFPLSNSGSLRAVGVGGSLAAVWRHSIPQRWRWRQFGGFVSIVKTHLRKSSSASPQNLDVALVIQIISTTSTQMSYSSEEDDLVPYFNQDVSMGLIEMDEYQFSGGGMTRRQCDRTAAKSAARVAATGGSWRHLGGTGGTFTVPHWDCRLFKV
ncbi:hypothetical protein B0H16DRAFT_1486044 [Mycena metata]|uniref:Uncharacterized protein n=1 Tax=Mycena metata TaxID=1033252 RepID=A0AAD7DKN1_9AGAR|nr:hypothetical protein B0H16DRAFT_1486044 [Mycena metata]